MVNFVTTTVVALLSATAACVTAFVPSRTAFVSGSSRTHTQQQQQQQQDKTVLYISSWGTKGPPSRWADTLERENPEEKIQAYLKEPEAVEARINIDGTCLVSGMVRNPDRTDQFIFDLLNHEESAFEYTKILAHVDNVKFAKKRLLSRSARYTGLLDKLDFVEAASPGSLPSVEQLTGVKSWLAYIDRNDYASSEDCLSVLKQIADIAYTARTVENVAVLLVNAVELDPASSQAALQSFHTNKRDNLSYTVVAVGKLEDHPEGQTAYQFEDFGTEAGVIPAKSIFSREESYRMITELLQLECGVNRALSFAEVYNVNQTEAKLIKGLREAGYARPQEIDHMIRKGVAEYKKYCEEWKTKFPDAAKGYTSDAWWEQEIYQESRRKSAEREESLKKMEKDERTKEIEAIAREWAKREYFRQSMAGIIDKSVIQTEEQFVESVWDRAMFEGDIKYRQLKGEKTDEESELADFKARQARKQEAMLKRAKKELADILQEDPDKLLPPSDDKKDKKE